MAFLDAATHLPWVKIQLSPNLDPATMSFFALYLRSLSRRACFAILLAAALPLTAIAEPETIRLSDDRRQFGLGIGGDKTA